MSDCCLHLFCPLSVEERLLDAILALDQDGTFTSTPVSVHGYDHGVLSTTEQVVGRSGSVHVQVLVREDELQALLDRLREELAPTGLRYWVTPVLQQGEFR